MNANEQQQLSYAGRASAPSSQQSVTGILGLIFSIPPAAVGLILLPLVLWGRAYGGTLPPGYVWVGIVLYILFALGPFILVPIGCASLTLAIVGATQRTQQRHAAIAALYVNGAAVLLWVVAFAASTR